MPTITVQATDTLFFRDGKPFSMGDDTFAQGIFPPPPGVWYGALRSTFISQYLDANKGGLEEAIIESEELKIESIAMSGGSNYYFPMPMDLIVYKSEKGPDYKPFSLSLEDSPKFSSAKTPKVLESLKDEKTNEEAFIMELLTIERYLNGNMSGLGVKRLSDFLFPEPKIGIGRNQYSHTTAEGKLYRIQSNRLSVSKKNGIQHLKFILTFRGLVLPRNGWMALGGERRVAFFEEKDPITVSCPVIDSAVFKIYLATPAIFEKGWKPEIFLEKYGLTLITAAIGKPLHIGGWDMKQKIPKPMLQCVPAGSVFYVKAENVEKAQAAVNAMHGKSITDNLNQTDYQAQGFGIAFIGKIKNEI